MTSEELSRAFVSEALEEVGQALLEDPNVVRPLRLLFERIETIIDGTNDPEVILLASYINLFGEHLYFNAFTDVSAHILIDERESIIKDIGSCLLKMSKDLKMKNTSMLYKDYFVLGRIWQTLPNLAVESEEKLQPPDITQEIMNGNHRLNLKFNSYPATVYCKNVCTSGLDSKWYKDIDFLTYNKDYCDELVARYVEKIQVMEMKQTINKLCFIENKFGPIGALPIASQIISETGIDGIFLRLRRRSPRYQFKGANLREGDMIIIISDMTTTGDSIIRACNTLHYKNLNLIIKQAIVFFDAERGAKDRLARNGINLISITNASETGDPIQSIISFEDELAPISKKRKDRLMSIYGEGAYRIMRENIVEF